MKQYNIDEFVWFTPSPKHKCAISFPRERAFNLNAALCAGSENRSTSPFIQQSLFSVCAKPREKAACKYQPADPSHRPN